MSPSSTVSVVMPNFNHGRFLRQSLGALLAQTLPPKRILVLDDGSTDGSVEILSELAKLHPNIEAHFYSDNRGAITRIIEVMETLDEEYILFAAADDVVMPTLLERSCALLDQYQTAGLCSADIVMIDENGAASSVQPTVFRPLSQPGFIDPQQAYRHLMRDDGWFWGNTTVYRRQALMAVGGFSAALEGFNDGYVCQVIALQFGVCFIPEILGCWRKMPGGMASGTVRFPERGVRVGALAESLMQGQNRDVVPPRYLERWKKRWLMNLIASQCQRSMTERRMGLQVVWSSRSALDRLFLWLAERLLINPALHRIAVMAYAHFRVTPFDIPMTIRHRTQRRPRLSSVPLAMTRPLL